MIKDWWTAQELADLELPGMPTTKFHVLKKANSDNWKKRARQGRGGGNEYHISNLPEEARLALIEKLVCRGRIRDKSVAAAPEDQDDRTPEDLRRDARVVILQYFDQFRRQSGDKVTAARTGFCMAYNEQLFPQVPAWVYKTFNNISPRTMRRWQNARKDAKFQKLGRGHNNRKGTGILDTAEAGAVEKHIGALILKQPHLTAGHIRDLCRAEFGELLEYNGEERELPNIRTFSRFIAKWKKDNDELIRRETDPDNWKNARMLAIGSADAKINRLNRVWEIDASPADIMCKDGRYNIYAIIDIWSRRMMVSVTKTAATEGSLALLRRAIKAWGVPEILKTDNGSDFISHRFVSAVSSIGIEQSICSPFSPEKKAYVERAIGTLQRDLMPVLPGFIGHSVKDRKAIESRKSFSQRLGEKDDSAFSVSLTHQELQEYIDEWCFNKYGNRIHSSINETPNLKAASWAGAIQKIENPRALDLLLAPLAGQDGFRTITKKGLRIDNNYYFDVALAEHVGKRVFVRCDANDMGLVYCFDADDKSFICEAVNLELQGVDRQAMAEASKAAQKAYKRSHGDEYKRQMRKITPEKMANQLRDQARLDASTVTTFPHRAEVYTSEELDAAASALTREKIAPEGTKEAEARLESIKADMSANQEFKRIESDEDRWYARWKHLDMKLRNGVVLNEGDQHWHESVQAESWWQSRHDMDLMRESVSQK